MAEMQTKHWANMAEVGSAWGLSLLYWVYRTLGRWPLQMILFPVLAYFYLFNATQRRASGEYLRRVHEAGGDLEKPGRLTGFRHFMSFADAILDKLVAWNGGIRLKDVDFSGRDEVAQRLSRHQGVLLVGSHLGNMEICRVLSQERGDFGLQVLVHTHHAPIFNRMIRRLNPNAHVSLVQVSSLHVGQAAELSHRLSQGDCIMIAGDRTPVSSARVVKVPFLGAEAEFSQGPWTLAALLGCPVYLVFCLPLKGRYQVSFELFSERIQLPRGSREKEIQALAARFAGRLEWHCKRAPLQWFNFYPFWRQS
jgi:predicted LPLAT superfamily acyltransferase